MTAQQEGLFYAGDGGLWRRFVTDSVIDHAAWLRALSSHEFVGTCRSCGGHLAPERPCDNRGRVDYTAHCISCRYEMTAPGGRLARPGHRPRRTT